MGGSVLSESFLEMIHPMIQDRVVRPGGKREQRLEILQEETAVLISEFDFAGVEGLTKRTAEDSQKDSAIEAAGMRMPIHIEECSECGLRTVLQNIHPPRIFGAGRHVIRNGIEQQPHATALELALQRSKFFFAAQFRVNARWIDDVISVTAAFATGYNRRQVQIGNAKFREVVENLMNVGEAKAAVQLYAVRRRWHSSR